MKLPLFLTALFALVQFASADLIPAQVVRIVDGDTIICSTASLPSVRVRLANIDAPEIKQRGGPEAKAVLSGMILDKPVILDAFPIDKFGRTVAVVLSNSADINQLMIQNGNAWVLARYFRASETRSLSAYLQTEFNARTLRRGLWNDPSPVAPWDYRNEGKKP